MGCPTGDESCLCYPNDTCNGSLACLSGRCVAAGAGGSGGSSPDSGGQSPDGGGGTGGESGAVGCPTGDESCPCYPNDTCNGFLACFSGRCVAAGAGGSGGVGACDAPAEPAVHAPLNIVFMIDKSGSMGTQDVNGDGDYEDEQEWENTAFRWDPVSAALVTFFQNPGAVGLFASLEFFPQGGDPYGPNTGACSPASYATPAVLLQSLDDPAASQLLVTRIENTSPSGGTPTLPALQGALDYARSTLADNPGSTSVVVLLTDGMPGMTRLEESTIYQDKCFCFGEPGCPDQDEIPYVAEAARFGPS